MCPTNNAAIKIWAAIWLPMISLFLASMLSAQEPVQGLGSAVSSSQITTGPQSVEPSDSVNLPVSNIPSDSYYQGTDSCPPISSARGDLDLIQQCRMAVGTEEMAFWSMPLFIVSALGTIFLVCTLVQTSKATKAAQASALAAERAVMVQRLSERALLNIGNLSLGMRGFGQDEYGQPTHHFVTLGLDIENAGKTAATDINLTYKIVVTDASGYAAHRTFADLDKRLVGQQFSHLATFLKSEDKKVTETFPEMADGQWEDVTAGRKELFFYGKVSFADVFKEVGEINFGYFFHVSAGDGGATLYPLIDAAFWADRRGGDGDIKASAT